MVKHLVVLSDSHDGAFYSRIHKRLNPLKGVYPVALYQALAQPNTTCVLNGDIFEFMHLYQSYDNQLEYAARWLSELLITFPNCHFHYTIGNHEDVAEFMQRLDRLSVALKRCEPPLTNFSWSKEDFQLGSVLALHGDLPIEEDKVKRDRVLGEKELRSREPTRFFHTLGNMLLGPLSKWKFPVPYVFDKVHGAYTKDDPDYFSERGITDVVIGHTHARHGVVGYPHKDLRFHITGHAGYLTRNNVLLFDLDDAGKVVKAESLDMLSAPKIALEAPYYHYVHDKTAKRLLADSRIVESNDKAGVLEAARLASDGAVVLQRA